MSYTTNDLLASSKFSRYNIVVRMINKLPPHLSSHLKAIIRDATQDDFYIPYNLLGKAKILEPEISAKLCEMLSCNNSTQDMILYKDNRPQYYYSGTNNFDIAGTPACYNLRPKPVYSENGERQVDIPQLKYYNDKCYIMSPFYSYLEKPLYRDTKRYAPLLNDMPTGMTLVKDDTTQTGVSFVLNEAYCNYYDKILDKNTGECTYTGVQKALDLVVGMNFIRTAESFLTTGLPGKRQKLPKNLPEYPKVIPERYTVNGWKNDIDKSFVPLEIIDYFDGIKPTDVSVKTIEHNNEKLNELKNLQKKLTQTDWYHLHHEIEIHKDIIKLEQEIKQQHDEIVKRTKINENKKDDNNNKNDNMSNHDSKDIDIGEDLITTMNRVKAILEALTASIISNPEEIILIVIADRLTDKALEKFRTLCVKLVEYISDLILKQAIKLSVKIGEKTLFASFKCCFADVVIFVGTNLIGKSVIALAEICAGLASVVGIVLAIACILDVIFTFWDIYGYNNQLNATFVRDLYLQGERAMRQMFGGQDVFISFDLMCSIVLPYEDLIEINLMSLSDRLYYLNSLTVNSEGSLIDKGELLSLAGLQHNPDQLSATTTSAYAKRVYFNLNTYNEFNKKFLRRMSIINSIKSVAYTLLCTSVLLIIFRLYIFAFIVILLMILITCCCRLSYTNDLILQGLENIDIFKRNFKE